MTCVLSVPSDEGHNSFRCAVYRQAAFWQCGTQGAGQSDYSKFLSMGNSGPFSLSSWTIQQVHVQKNNNKKMVLRMDGNFSHMFPSKIMSFKLNVECFSQ